jgi:hypothetical protein
MYPKARQHGRWASLHVQFLLTTYIKLRPILNEGSSSDRFREAATLEAQNKNPAIPLSLQTLGLWPFRVEDSSQYG